MFWKRFWQVWFVIAILVFNSNVFRLNLNNPETLTFIKNFHTNIFDLGHSILDILSLVGIFGFAWNKKIFNKKFWKIFLPLIIIFNFIYSLTLPLIHLNPFSNESHHHIPTLVLGVIMAISSIFNVLIYLPLIFYGFKRNNLWDNVEIKTYSRWKIFFIFILFSAVYNYLLLSLHLKSLNLYERFDFAVAIILSIGLYCFAWNKKFFNKIFWQIFLVAYFVWLIAFFFLFPHSEIMNILILNNFSIITTIWAGITFAFGMVALFNYAFRSKNIWNPNSLKDLNDEIASS